MTHNLLITWAPEPKAPPRHLSAAGVLRAARLRNDVERRGRLARVTQLALAQKLNQTDLLALFAEADALYAQRVSSRRARYMAALYDPANIPPEPVDLAGAEAEVEARIDELVAEMREFYLSQPPEDPAARKVFDELKVLDKRLDALGTLNARDEQLIADELARLRRHVEGKVCLIGSTATGAADFVPTPMNPRTPGVVVHANVFNTIISGQFVRAAHPGVGVAIILAAGAAVALVTALARVWLAAVATVLLAAAHTLFSFAGAFGAWHLWLPVAAPLTAMLASFLFVTAYRQLTEERAKRRIRGMFAHALSPALVDELLADPSLAALGGQRRRITCLFSDIRGFTPLSQRLGPQRTVRLLNQYFDRVTDAVQTRGGGYINKFLGDGIFAFFGAPVLQDDHAARALTAAVEYQRRVAALNDALRGDGTGDVSLAVRIGIATGEAMVGNCGSSTRMDYTAIGDCVNLASRLEASNKFFGTRILVAEEAWRAAGGEADYSPARSARCSSRDSRTESGCGTCSARETRRARRMRRPASPSPERWSGWPIPTSPGLWRRWKACRRPGRTTGPRRCSSTSPGPARASHPVTTGRPAAAQATAWCASPFRGARLATRGTHERRRLVRAGRHRRDRPGDLRLPQAEAAPRRACRVGPPQRPALPRRA